jgi:ELWxxDGT repeat protein
MASLAACVGFPALAGEPFLVKDINSSPYDSTIEGLFELGGTLLFAANDGLTGPELWKSDGTDEGTVLVEDIWPGKPGSHPEEIQTAAGLVFFCGSDGARSGIWRSDGTPEGTFCLKEGAACSVSPGRPASSGSLLYFWVRDEARGYALWRSDGTLEGTFSILEPGAGSNADFAVGPGGLVFFDAWGSPGGTWLWRSDGTSAGTFALRQVTSRSCSAFHANLGDIFLFSGSEAETGCEPWRSDGTPEGTFLLKDIRPGTTGSGPRFLGEAGGSFLFWASDQDAADLWKTDGTSEGTVKVKDSSGARYLAASVSSAGKVFFVLHEEALTRVHVSDGTPDGTFPLTVTGTGGNGMGSILVAEAHGLVFFQEDGTTRLWRTDGTVEGTLVLKDMAPDAWRLAGFLELEEEIVLFARDPSTKEQSLWRTDGTPAGTFKIKEGLSAATLAHARMGRHAYFAGNDGSGWGLWKTDGTTRGTVIVKGGFGTTGWSQSSYLAAFQGRLFFAATTPGSGNELWASDGSPEGTAIFKDIVPGTESGTPKQLVATAGLLFFTPGHNDLELWRSDGTPEGTRMVLDVVDISWEGGLRGLTAAADLLFFLRGYFYLGPEVWRSDGTAGGTFRVKKLAPTWRDSPMAPLGKSLLFFGADEASAFGLWISDGTEGGTVLLATFCPPECSYFPEFLAERDGSVFFVTGGGENGVVLWKTDGTPRGTLRIGDVEPFLLDSTQSHAGLPGVVAGSLFFFAANDRETGTELWRSDGTAGGTTLVKDISPGSPSSEPEALTGAGDLIFFLADDGKSGRELWRSDGTEAGTFLVKDTCPGTCGSAPNPYTGDRLGWVAQVEGEIFFSGYSTETGWELWRSDGTPEGTRLAADIYPGPGWSKPSEPVVAGGLLFFKATDPIHSEEPWAVEIEGHPAFRRGDGNADGKVDIADALVLLSALFSGGPAPPCPDAADADDDGRLAITDAIYELQWLFQGGPEPPSPGPGACGPDGTGDGLARCAYEVSRC